MFSLSQQISISQISVKRTGHDVEVFSQEIEEIARQSVPMAHIICIARSTHIVVVDEKNNFMLSVTRSCRVLIQFFSSCNIKPNKRP